MDASGTPGPLTAKQEWAAMWPLPMTAMFGVVVCSAFTYTNGLFLTQMTHEFGWTRTQYASSFTLQMAFGLLLGPVTGKVIDRIGPRRVALIGIGSFVIGFSLLALADGSIWQWRLLCVVQGLGVAFLSPVTWIVAVTGRFNASRGFALSMPLAGVGIGTIIWPLLAAGYIGTFGWRLAFPALALTAAAVLLPLTYFFFFGPRDRPMPGVRVTAPAGPRPRLGPIFRSRTFICLLAAGGLYAAVSIGFMLNLVPILMGNGFSLGGAARVASIAGIFGLIGRFGTGYLLDILPVRVFGVFAFLVPIIFSFLFWLGKDSTAFSISAAASLGLITGAESDILAYLASRRLDASIFASVYAVMSSVFAVCASVGPLLASALFDASGSYSLFFLVSMPISAAAATLIWLVPAVPAGRDLGSDRQGHS
jgi:predicted MFS family arabinose efflux permease